MALANLPCRCLFHPFCMFKIVLGKNPPCPSCDHLPGRVWLGQWGLVTNNATMQGSIHAYRAALDAEGCAEPLSREDAQVIIREISSLAATLTEIGWSTRKRNAVANECEPEGGPAKFPRVEVAKSQTISTEKMKCRIEGPFVNGKPVESWDGNTHLGGVLCDAAMLSSAMNSNPSVGRSGVALLLKSIGVHNKLGMEGIQIANDEVAESVAWQENK